MEMYLDGKWVDSPKVIEVVSPFRASHRYDSRRDLAANRGDTRGGGSRRSGHGEVDRV